MPVCQECKTSFKARATAKFCSDKCRKANRRKPDKSDKKSKENYQYPEPPEYLLSNQLAMEVWNQLREQMKDKGVYLQVDAAKIARYCCLEAEFRLGPEEYPSAKLAQLRLNERDLYLSPDARDSYGTGDAPPENPFASLLQKNK